MTKDEANKLSKAYIAKPEIDFDKEQFQSLYSYALGWIKAMAEAGHFSIIFDDSTYPTRNKYVVEKLKEDGFVVEGDEVKWE